jgi:uncharacterized PurR-regulated membrane protein YhhQ (DUF165 family)
MKSLRLWRIRYSLLYMAMIPFVNWLFGQPWHYVMMPDGNKWSPFSVVVGLILVVRDMAQREIGHYIFFPLCIGVALSFAMAPPGIATASALAFFISESIDWSIFTFTHAPLSTRIVLSSTFGSIADTFVFLYGANTTVPGIFSAWMISTMLLSKISGAVAVFFLLRQREKRAARLQAVSATTH